MEPDERSPVAPEPGDGTLGSKSGVEVGNDGSKAVGSVPELSVTLQEGKDKTEREAEQTEKPDADKASDTTAVANDGDTPTKENGGGGSSDGVAAAKAAAAGVEATESPSGSEPQETKEEAPTTTGARATDGISRGTSEPDNAATGTGGPGDAPSTDDTVGRGAEGQEKHNKAEETKSPAATAPPKKVVLSGSGASLPASLLTKKDPPEAPLDSTPETPNAEAPARVLTERRGAENGTTEGTGDGVTEPKGAENGPTEEGVGGAAAWEGSVSPTPPRTRSNPISRGTPPQRGSRGGNLAICTQQPYSPGGEDGRDWPKPSSPRSRPRGQPLVRAKNDARGGGGGTGADGCSGDDEVETKEKVASFSSRRWKASDEYVLDEDR